MCTSLRHKCFSLSKVTFCGKRYVQFIIIRQCKVHQQQSAALSRKGKTHSEALPASLRQGKNNILGGGGGVVGVHICTGGSSGRVGVWERRRA